MTHGDGSGQLAAGRSHPLGLTPAGAGGLIPLAFYGLVAFLPPLALTLYINRVMGEGWEPLSTWLVIHNIMAFLIYGYDKLIAPSGVMRVPELVLLLEVLTGAFVGAPLAGELFRHKTQKLPFRQRFWLAEIVAVAWVVIYYGVLALSGYSWSL